jgi:hypothetical protein
MPDNVIANVAGSTPILSFDRLRDAGDHRVRIACDTEFQGPLTLSAQFSVRSGDDLIVQVYRNPVLPQQPVIDFAEFQAELQPYCKRLVVRPIGVLGPTITPVAIIRDLLGVYNIFGVPRAEMEFERATKEGYDLELIGHFWPADFFRIYSSNFFTGLLRDRSDPNRRLNLRADKTICFREARGYQDPSLEFASEGFVVRPVRIRMFDTALSFGRASLDDLAQTFLGIGKDGRISTAEKAEMHQTFLRRPTDAYKYAMRDPVLTLLMHERMREADHRMYIDLGFEESEVPRLLPTQGSRVAETVVRSLCRAAATGSALLSRKGKRLTNGTVGKVSMGKVKALIVKGGSGNLIQNGRSRFGEQIGETHGGLLLTRSPDRFFYAAPGMMRDVDLSGCYAHILEKLSLYAGQPIVHEPGSGGMTLNSAIELMEKHAAGRDAWIVKVSGKISNRPNALIASTKDALTNANHSSRTAKARARQRRFGFTLDWMQESKTKNGNTVIYSDVVEGGIVAWATWLMIQALPPDWRREYENLEVDSILFYPRQLVAHDGPDYDRLVAEVERPGTDWASILDLENLQQTTIENFGADHVSLRFPIGELAQKIQAFRDDAIRLHGKGTAAEKAWKQHVNSLYGVTASKYLATNNVVLANVITATARALAFAMSQSLNAIQTITDGANYRRDQIPAGTFAECLAAANDYPIHRIEDGVRFIDLAQLPDDDNVFTAFYKGHIMKFFGVSGRDYEELFGLHRLEHKRCGAANSPVFDGLCCDGSANYLKLILLGNNWQVVDHKARGYAKTEKELLAPWLIKTLANDQYQGPPPITECKELLSYREAQNVADAALREIEEHEAANAKVLFPMGLERHRPKSYKLIKPTAYIFRSAQQRDAILKQYEKFADRYACGLEVLALRQTRPNRRHGSVVDLATFLYRYIRSGAANITKSLNLTREFPALLAVKSQHADELHRLKAFRREELHTRINARNMDEAAKLTGLFVGRGDRIHI